MAHKGLNNRTHHVVLHMYTCAHVCCAHMPSAALPPFGAGGRHRAYVAPNAVQHVLVLQQQTSCCTKKCACLVMYVQVSHRRPRLHPPAFARTSGSALPTPGPRTLQTPTKNGTVLCQCSPIFLSLLPTAPRRRKPRYGTELAGTYVGRTSSSWIARKCNNLVPPGRPALISRDVA